MQHSDTAALGHNLSPCTTSHSLWTSCSLQCVWHPQDSISSDLSLYIRWL